MGHPGLLARLFATGSVRAVHCSNAARATVPPARLRSIRFTAGTLCSHRTTKAASRRTIRHGGAAAASLLGSSGMYWGEGLLRVQAVHTATSSLEDGGTQRPINGGAAAIRQAQRVCKCQAPLFHTHL